MNSVDKFAEAPNDSTNHRADHRPMNLAIFEPSLYGHRGIYLTEITTEAIRRGWSVTVVTTAKDRDNPYFSKVRALIGQTNLVFTPFWVEFPKRVSPLSMLRYHFRNWQAARQSLFTNYRPWDFVYVPTLDSMDRAIPFLGAPSHPIPMGGMEMRIRFHLRQLGVETHRSLLRPMASLSFSRLLKARSLACVTTADPSLAKFCQGQRASIYRKVLYVPEIGMVAPTRDSAAAKRQFGFQDMGKVILIFGQIDQRKASIELINAISRANPTEKIQILIVGLANQDTREILESDKYDELRRQGVLVTRFGFADNETQDMAFAAADVVWIAYRNHSTMSGVFAQAMSCSLPVIAPNYGLLSWLVSEYRVGITVDINNPAAAGSQIIDMLQDAESMKEYGANAALIAHRHQPRNFGSAVCDAIAVGRGTRPNAVSPRRLRTSADRRQSDLPADDK